MFFAYCPDVTNGLAARLKVRERHLERWKKDMETGHAGTLVSLAASTFQKD
jgi:hypothetical protein